MLGITKTKKEQTLKVVFDVGEPVTEYIPIIREERVGLYKKFLDMGVILPTYETFQKVKDIELADIQVLTEDYPIYIEYGDYIYNFVFKKGFCFDGASIPDYLRFGWIANNSQYSLNASMVHDALYALNFFPKKDCDNFFEGILRHNLLKEFWIFIYIAGLAVGGGKKYKELTKRYVNKSDYWGYEFVTISVHSK